MPYTINPNMPKIRQQAADLVRRGWSARKVGRYLGFHHTAVMKWVKKSERIGYHPIPTESSKPNSHPRQLSDDLVNQVIAVRTSIGRSSEVVHRELANHGINVSLSSVKRTLDRNHLLKKRSPFKRYHPTTERPEALNPGDLVQLDTIHIMKNKSERMYVFTLIDVYSRWAYARAYRKANTFSALDFLGYAKRSARFEFRHLQSDHGSEFSTHFTERSGITHRHSRVRRPNDNAHLERFNRTLQEECLDKLPRNVEQINHTLPVYLEYYNTRRLHFGINLKTPLEVVLSY
jgi:transposase InsO family protein